MLSHEFIEEMKKELLQAKEKFTEEMDGLPQHTEIGSEEDENAEEVEFDEVNSELRNRLKTDLAKIEAALEKIENGTYGTDNDGKEIGEDRLRALPWADKAL